jgi:hypothetical protein
MNYKNFLEDQFAFRELDEEGYLQFSRVDNDFFYSKEINGMCAVVASCVNDVIKIENIPLLEKYLPGVLDEMIGEIVQEVFEAQHKTEEEFIKQTIEHTNKLHTIAIARTMKKKNEFD